LAFLKNPKFRLRPVIACIEKHFLPLRQTLDWGYSIPYMITGMLNEHPRSAIAVRESKHPDEYVSFYDEMVEKA
jgi:4-hydroxy 2-oxovalerate aldolase